MSVIARMWSVWVCFAAGLLALAPDARSQTPSLGKQPRLIDLFIQTREARLAGDNKGWLERGQRVLQLAPDHPDLLISVARAFAANGRFDDAATRLEDAVRRGGGFDLATLPEFKSAPDTARLRALRERALQNMAPVAAPEIFLVLQNESLHTEGITWDPVGRHLYIGSLNGEIWRVDLGGKLERFAGPGSGLREVLGLKVDAERRLLWAATGVFPDLIPTGEPKKDVGTTGLHAYNLETGKRVRDSVNSIDGLVWDGKDLLGIQSNPYLARVARIRLADDGLSVREVATMSSRPPPGLNLKTGVVVSDQFYMVADFREELAALEQAQPRSHILRTRVR